jgi:hypothetical protein
MRACITLAAALCVLFAPWRASSQEPGIEFVMTVEVGAISNFTMAQHEQSARIMSSNLYFETEFFGWEEPPTVAAELTINRLAEGPFTHDVEATLSRSCVTLGQLIHLVYLQETFDEGGPLVPHGLNLACVKNKRGELWTLVLYWSEKNKGWDLKALPAGLLEFDPKERGIGAVYLLSHGASTTAPE